MIKKNFTFLLLAFILAGLVKAGPIEALISGSGNSADYPNAGYLTLFDSTRVEVQESGLSYFYTRRLHKVLTVKGGLSLSVVKYDYDPLSAMAEIRKVIIYRVDGHQEEISTGLVQDYPAPARAIYWGAREIMLGVGKLEVGDALEIQLFKKGFTYALLQADDEDRFIPPMRGHFYDIVPFWTEEPVLEKVYSVVLPDSKTLRYKVYNGSLAVNEKKSAGKWFYTFSGKNLLPVKAEPSMVDKSDVSLKLLLSTSADWESKSVWFHGVNEDFGSFASTPEINAKVADILREARDETDSISLLTHWCADEIRYSGISMGKGEGFTLHTGDMTFRDRAGVCKDKAGMLITMLRAAGFESYAAMTMAGSRIDDIPADQFNHCVTVVKRRDGTYQLLDPTWVPFVRELWSSAEQQQNYLMGLPQGAGLMETPVSAPENHYLRMTATSALLPDGSLEGSITLTAEGQTDAAIRRMFTGNFQARWRQQLENELLKIHPRAKLIHYEMANPYHYLSGPITILLQYHIPQYAIITTENIIFTPLLLTPFFKNAQAHLNISTAAETRQFPFRDRCSRQVQLTETITLPSKAGIAWKPEAQQVQSPHASWSGNIALTGNTLKVTQEISLGKRVYEAADWPAFRQVVLNQKDFAREIILKVQ